jgi:hypothetical protein
MYVCMSIFGTHVQVCICDIDSIPMPKDVFAPANRPLSLRRDASDADSFVYVNGAYACVHVCMYV